MIKVGDKQFKLYLTHQEIAQEVARVANEISTDYQGRCPLLVSVLTGSVMFATDLMRAMDLDAELQFVKYSSYSGTSSTGEVHRVLGFSESVKGRDVIVIEDIVESGLSMQTILSDLQALQPASIAVCTFFYKPGCFNGNFKLDYVGKQIEDDFIVGYGLDYDGMGRGYKDVYQLSVDE